MDGIDDEERSAVVAPAAFIVRAWRDAAGTLSGVVERVTTGEKARFHGVEVLGEVLQRLLDRPRPGTSAEG